MLWEQGPSSCRGLCSENKGKGLGPRHDAPSRNKLPHSPLRRDGTAWAPSPNASGEQEMLNNQTENSRSPRNELLHMNILLEQYVLAQERIFILSSKIVKSGNLGTLSSFCFILWDIHLHTHTLTHIHIPMHIPTHKYTNMWANTHAHNHTHTHLWGGPYCQLDRSHIASSFYW